MHNKARNELQQLTIIAMFIALGVVLRLAKIVPIPNVQPVTDMLMIITMYLPLSSSLIIAIGIMLISNIILGFGIWTLGQICAYTFCILLVFGLNKLTPLKKHKSYQLILAFMLGYLYGLIVSLSLQIFGGWAAFITYWISGLPFDTYHALGNIGFYLPVSLALSKALDYYQKRILM